MRKCSLCKKKYERGSGTLFGMPKDIERRNRWSQLCGKNFAPSALLCPDHFKSAFIIRMEKKMVLLPNAEPCIKIEDVKETQKQKEQDVTRKSLSLDKKKPLTVWIAFA